MTVSRGVSRTPPNGDGGRLTGSVREATKPVDDVDHLRVHRQQVKDPRGAPGRTRPAPRHVLYRSDDDARLRVEKAADEIGRGQDLDARLLEHRASQASRTTSNSVSSAVFDSDFGVGVGVGDRVYRSQSGRPSGLVVEDVGGAETPMGTDEMSRELAVPDEPDHVSP